MGEEAVAELEFAGALGDIVLACYRSDRYVSLERLSDGERAHVTVASLNPHSHELFRWHRNGDRITVDNVDYTRWFQSAVAKGCDRPIDWSHPPRKEGSVRFYPSPADELVLERLAERPYVALALAAGGPERNVPLRIAEDVAEEITERGYTVALLGRTWPGHEEVRLAPRTGVVDCIDGLTVPGTFQALERADAVVCAFSAVMLLCWSARLPNYVLYPSLVRDRELRAEGVPWRFGLDYPETAHSEFSAYSRTALRAWLDGRGK